MEIGMYEKEVEDKEIREIAERILPDTSFGKIYRICEQYGEEEADCREYDVYKLVTPEGDRMLKKADKREVSNYEKYLKQKDFCVPEFYGRWDDGADIWIMLESTEGNDLRDMTDELAKAAAKSIVQIQNSFWNHPDRERFEVYLEMLALISVNLGVMNLLPIPGLDGSRLLFLLVEAIRRKPVKRELEGAIHLAGFALLMGLMVLLTYKDIIRFFVKG